MQLTYKMRYRKSISLTFMANVIHLLRLLPLDLRKRSQSHLFPRTGSKSYKATMIQVIVHFSHLVIILQYVSLSLKPILWKIQPVLNLFISKIKPISPWPKINWYYSRVFGFTCKAASLYLIVWPNGSGNAKLILDHLKNSYSDFHTFCPPSSRLFRIVIRNLHHSTFSSDTSDALTELGHSVRHVENIKKNKISQPIFL